MTLSLVLCGPIKKLLLTVGSHVTTSLPSHFIKQRLVPATTHVASCELTILEAAMLLLGWGSQFRLADSRSSLLRMRGTVQSLHALIKVANRQNFYAEAVF